MRANLILFFGLILVTLFTWVSMSGIWVGLGLIFILLFLVIAWGYADSFLLFILRARELRSSDHQVFFEGASQSAYKLLLSIPRLYYYSGYLERAFVLQARDHVSIVISKGLLESSSPDELAAICFELLLQVKKKMAIKRTRSMFVLGFVALFVFSLTDYIFNLLRFHKIKKGVNTWIRYFLSPVMDFVFSFAIGEGYFKKLARHLEDYPIEKNLLNQFGHKAVKPNYSPFSPSKKILEFYSGLNGRYHQNVLLLEFLPHEWDYFFKDVELVRAE